ncbi:MAG: diacylglycerol kinase (ATP) [Sphingobacteriales bacterium]|jgi:diacylglycerol kinase (ATP)
MLNELKKFGFAFEGIRTGVKEHPHFRFHVVASAVVIGLAFYFNISFFSWGLLVLAMAMVLISELINSALETFCNLVEPNYNIHIKKVKDMGAAAVLVASIAALTLLLVVVLLEFGIFFIG